MFGHAFNGYANQNLGGAFTPIQSSNIAANALNNVQQPDYPLAFDQYTGEPLRMLSEIVWQVGIMDKSNFFLTDILPVQETNKLTVDMNMTVFDPKLMDTNPEWSQAKLVSFSKRQRRKRLERRGLQMELEQGFADTEYGRDTFNRYVMAIIKSQQDTLSIEILLALEQAPLDTEELMLKKDPRWRGMSITDYLADEIFFYGIMQKNPRPFEALDARIRKNMAFVDGQYDTLIVPAHVTGFAKSAMNKYLDYDKAGPAGPALSRSNPDNNDNRSLYPGISGDLIVPLRPTFEQYRTNHGAALMTSPYTVGEYYCCRSHIDFSSKYWTPDNQAIEIYDESDSTRKKISLLEICLNSGLFRKDGSLIGMNDPDMPYRDFSGDLNVDSSKGIHDMWSDENGQPLRFFGQMNKRHLNTQDIVHWAKAVAAHLKREYNLTAEQYVDPQNEAKIGNVLGNIFPRSSSLFSQALAQTTGISPAPSDVQMKKLPPGSVFAWIATTEEDRNDGAILRTKREQVLKKLKWGQDHPDIRASALFVYAANSIPGVKKTPLIREDATQEQARRVVAAVNEDLSEEQQRQVSVLLQKFEAILQSGEIAGTLGTGVLKMTNQVLSKEQVAQIAEDWKNDIFPRQIPSDPTFTSGWLPMTKTDLLSYFGSGSQRQRWPDQPYWIGSHMAALHRLVNSNNGEHDVRLASLHENASQNLRSVLRQFSIGDKAANEALLNPRQYFFTEAEAQEIMDISAAVSSADFLEHARQIDRLDGLVGLLATKFLLTEIHETNFVRWGEMSLPLPVQGVIFRPNITHRVSHAIACMRGRVNLGYTAIGKAKFTYGSDPGPQSIMGHFTFYSLPVIEKPWNVAVIPAITIDSYIGGKGTQWINVKKEMQNKSTGQESMLGLIIPLRAEMPFVTSITGSTFDLERVQQLQLLEEPYFPQAARFRVTAGTWKMYCDDQDYIHSRPGYNQRNFICLPGKYWFREELEFKGIHEGKGHFENTDGPDAMMIRRGSLKQYAIDAGGGNRY